MRRAATLIATVTLACCAGEAVHLDRSRSVLDGEPLASNGDRLDAGVTRADMGAPATVSTKPDAQPAVGGCSQWSAWKCQEIPVVLCKATCGTSTTSYSISCLKNGGCVCGLSPGLCGPYSYASPCDACRQAFEKGCCKTPLN